MDGVDDKISVGSNYGIIDGSFVTFSVGSNVGIELGIKDGSKLGSKLKDGLDDIVSASIALSQFNNLSYKFFNDSGLLTELK